MKRGFLRGAALTLALCAAAQAGPPQGQPLMITLPPNVLASAQGANGFVVAGTFFDGGAFHWMPTSGVTDIGGTQGVAVSRDGKTIVGRERDSRGFEQAAIWTGGRTWRLLGSVGQARPCDLLLSGSFGASDDGRVVVGLAWDGCAYARAFRWEESTGMVDLGTLSGGSTRANDVSGDGRVVVGWDTHATGFRQAAKWIDGRGELIRGPADLLGEAFGANRDGTLIVGTGCDPTNPVPPKAWTWTPSAGVTCFPLTRPPWAIPRFYNAYMYSTSDDGRVIGGALSFGLDAESVVWFDGEPVYLRDYLRSNGVPDAFEGWVNTGFVTAVSADGRTLVGYGAGPRAFQGFVVVLPELGAK
jgi:probable HAF family extracellular repeat protein